MIRFESEGSPIFRQIRIGKHEKQFALYKLRTMKRETAVLPTHEVSATQITRVGSLLRRTRLDESPQLWNVLIGNMNIVGPRPCLPSQQDVIKERQKRDVFSVRPGITGLAQIQGIEMSTPVRLAIIDREYIDASSLATDAKLIIYTMIRLWRPQLSKRVP